MMGTAQTSVALHGTFYGNEVLNEIGVAIFVQHRASGGDPRVANASLHHDSKYAALAVQGLIQGTRVLDLVKRAHVVA